jgi:ABC-type Fe3+ transport system substrate-binding protein
VTKPYTITLLSKEKRDKAFEALRRAPEGYRVTFEEPKRSDEQNRRLWAMLSDVASQVEYYGEKMPPESWKDLFTAAMKKELKVVPSLDGKGIVQIGLRTSKMSKAELTDLMELIAAYGAAHDVTFHDKDNLEAA